MGNPHKKNSQWDPQNPQNWENSPFLETLYEKLLENDHKSVNEVYPEEMINKIVKIILLKQKLQ